MNTLPPGQTRILAFFAEAEDHGRQPSRAEVAESLGYAFPSAVSKHVEALVRKGLLEAVPEKKRNVRLTATGWRALGRSPARHGVPVIGAIAAGAPILALENVSEHIGDLQPKAGRIALRVRGDSMIDAGILDGDYAVIQSGQPISDGQIAAVVVDGEATLKRWKKRDHGIDLVAENARYQPIHIPSERLTTIQVVGPLSFVYRLVR
ncbi:MAG: transcriptional repressor LexA [Planctomycetota bacterium]